MEKKSPQLPKNEFIPPEASFKFFIRTMAIQTSINLGVLENPITNEKQENISQAKLLIETLEMLREKTKGNLNEEEANSLNNILAELKPLYESKKNKSQN